MWPAQSQGEAGRTAREINCRTRRGQGKCFSRHSERTSCAHWLCIVLHNLHPVPPHSDVFWCERQASPCQTPRSLPDSIIKYVSVSSLHLILSDMKFKGRMGMYMTLVILFLIPHSDTHQLRSWMSWLQISMTWVSVNRASFLYSRPKWLSMLLARSPP